MDRKWLANSLVLAVVGTVGLIAAPAHSAPLAVASPASLQEAGGWDQPPGEFREVQRKGFHDGVEGARKDAENHRRPSVENRDEYRHPDVPRGDRHDYREAFRRGYEAGVAHLMRDGGGPR